MHTAQTKLSCRQCVRTAVGHWAANRAFTDWADTGSDAVLGGGLETMGVVSDIVICSRDVTALLIVQE